MSAPSERSLPRPDLHVAVIAQDATDRATLRHGLVSSGFAVTVHDHGTPATSVTRGADVTVVDLDHVPAQAIESTIAHLHRTGTPIVALASGSPAEQRAAVLGAGADDFVGKPAAWVELTARLRAIIRRVGRAAPPPATVRADGLEADLDGRRVTVDGLEVTLTSTEWRILDTLVRQPGCLVDHDTLTTAVWGTPRPSDGRSLRVHISNLRRKLGTAGERLIGTDHGLGYRWHGPGAPRTGEATALPAQERV